MAFCGKKVEYPYLTITYLNRNGVKGHYAFIGLEMMKKYKDISNSLKNNIERKKLKKDFGDFNINLWLSAIKNKEKLFFINNRIWLDDTIYNIKLKIFYFISVPEKYYLLPNNQELWMNIDNKNKLLGHTYYKEEFNDNIYISYEPSIYNKPKIDNDFITKDDERTLEKIKIKKNNNTILSDIINKLQFNNQLFLYDINDEIEFIELNPLKFSEKKILNGYYYKYWPFYKKSSINSLKFYNDIKNKIPIRNKIISSVREEKIKIHKNVIFEDCLIWKMNIILRPPLSDIPYRLVIIYNYLRTLLSKDLPFIYYINSTDLVPAISIHEKSTIDNSIDKERLESWIYKKTSDKKKIFKKKPKINFKYLSYISKSGKSKYTDVSIYKNGQIDIQLSTEEDSETYINNIIKYINSISSIIKKINNCFLKKQKHKLLCVPEIEIKNDKFILSKYTTIQYYQTINNFKTEEKIDFNLLIDFLNSYKLFIDTTFTEKNKEIINLIYNRTSNNSEKALIFEFISKEKSLETDNNKIVDMIIKNFGLSRIETEKLFNEWYILKTDKQIAKVLLKQPGIKIRITKSNLYDDNNFIYKLSIAGLKNLFLLQTSFSFIKNTMLLFFNPIKKNKIFIDKDFDINFGFDDNVIEKNNFNKSISNNNNKNNINNLLNSDKLSSLYSSSEGVDMKDESKLDPKIRLKCKKEENKLDDKGMCKDVCDFPNFKLNRLHKFVPELTNYKPPLDQQPYSRYCSEKRRPIVVSKNIFDNPKLDKKSYTYAINYKSGKDKKEFSYICPTVWCPTCEIPIPLEKVTDIKIKNVGKGNKCEYGACPHGNHNVLINRDNDKNPGFLTMVKTPHGKCIPCCFGIPQINKVIYKRCLNIESDNSNLNNIKYIGRKDKLKLPENKYGLLPKEIQLFLEQKEQKPGNLKNGFDNFVRKGVKLSNDSIINSILDVLSIWNNKKMTKDNLMKSIFPKITKQLFNSLNGGLLRRVFGSIENYKTYLSKDKIENIFIWDLFTRPTILTKEGFNIVIFKTHSIFCPYGQNPKELYSYSKPTLLLFKFENIYEPIYRIQYENNKIIISCFQNSLEPYIKKTIDYAIKGCSPYDIVDWNKIQKTNRIKKEELSLNNTIKELKDKFKIKLQITDKYSKTTGVILDNNLYIPVKPSRISLKYPYLETNKSSDIPILDIKKTLKLLEDISKKTILPIKPLQLIINKKCKDNVIGLLLETSRIIPVKSVKLKTIKTKLNISDRFYYKNIDSNNLNSKEKEKRNEKIKKYNYGIEGFERFKYEFSSYLQENDKNKNNIIMYLDNNKISLLKKEIDNILKKIIASKEKSIKKLKIVFKNINSKKILRISCYNSSPSAGILDKYCICDKKQCKFIYYNIKFYKEKLIDLLLRYPLDKIEILEGTLQLIDISKSMKEHQTGEILLTGNKIDEYFNTIIYNNKNNIELKLINNINLSQPSFKGIDKKKYLKEKDINKEIETFSVVEIAPNWISIVDPIYRLIIPNERCNSFYFNMSKIISRVLEKSNQDNFTKINTEIIENITNNNIKEFYGNFIKTIPTEDIKKIASVIIEDIEKDTLENIVDISDLYNLYNNKEQIKSVDDLSERIKAGYTAYIPNKFDLILFSYILNINIILLRISISEVIGPGFIDSELYFVLFYKYTDVEQCISYYLLNRKSKPYISKINTTLKRLIR